MGSSSHLKRLAMPRSWALPRKVLTWVQRPRAGSHSLEMSMPLGVIMRDIVGVATNQREVSHILHSRQVKVDGSIVTDARRGVGFMDVLTLGEDHYRCVIDTNGRLRYNKISSSDAEWKICRINGKSTLKGGITQINLHDGRNILVKDASEFSTGDTLKISLPEQKILTHIPFTEGARAYLTGGSHVGVYEIIKEYIVKRSSMPNEVNFEDFGTIAKYVFLVNDDTPLPLKEVNV